MNWTIEYNSDVQKILRKIDPQTRNRIRSYLHERIAKLDDPRQIGSALQGSELGNYWRYRVGDYRILCDIQDNKLVVLVIEIGHRREVYR
ncbi:type II toxin-antitoxin system RelE family toxin [Agrobacterium sp. rho-13.3]|uniref:type II toxin-antitoxin system RelE family toxin n=1 Tax=Agrobacterium sp. rho-13.3 TaxID=3072980 RepID=UPI002A0F9D3F|nr:type II toxin-antitoxin system RelE/ParE family toxin [Agrobacterium sp. rho-13.3]MDX8310403.1 type II toxin-antitoxin system RelE/ParE family toxin [Agrobacterium sp. rho-13.3]